MRPRQQQIPVVRQPYQIDWPQHQVVQVQYQVVQPQYQVVQPQIQQARIAQRAQQAALENKAQQMVVSEVFTAGGTPVTPMRPSIPGQGMATADLGYALRLGVVLGIADLVVTVAENALYYATKTPGGGAHIVTFLALAGMVALAIVSGLLAARRDGSLGSAALAGGIVSLATGIGVAIADIGAHETVQTIAVVAGLLSLTLSIVSGLVGRWQYRSE